MMNNKLIWLCLALIIAVGTTFATFFYQTQVANMQRFNANVEQQKQKIAVLNDQIVVLQRKLTTAQPSKQDVAKPVMSGENIYLKEQFVKDYIELIQLNIQQQQFDHAIENIQQLKQKLISQPLLNEALNSALLEALDVDQKSIHQYIKYRTEHLLLLQTHLTQLEKMLQPLDLDQAEEKWDFKQWFSLTRAENTPDLQNRDLTYRHLQLRILLAQQALMAGQLEFYQQQITDFKQQLKLYPDTQSKAMLMTLNKIESLSMTALPKMTALNLLRGT